MNLDLIAMITMLIIMSLFGIGILLSIWNWNIIMFDYYMVGSMYYT